MLKFFEILKNIWSIDELKNRILLTLFFLAIYRLGAQVVLPGVDYNIIADAKIAGAVFFFAGSKIILYFLILLFFKAFFTSVRYFELVLIIG